MKPNLNITILIILVVFLLSTNCTRVTNTKREIIVTEFPCSFTLEGNNVKEYQQFCPTSIAIIDTLLITIDGCDEKLFQCYNKNTLQYIGSFGNLGRGPSELMDPEITGDFSRTENGATLVISEPNLNRVSTLDIAKGLSGMKETIIQTYSLPGLISFPYENSIIDDSLIIGNSSYGLGRMYLYNLVNGDLNWIDFFPEVSTPVKKSKLSELYNSIIRESDYHNRIVTAMLSFERIDIFNYMGELEISVIIDNENPEPDFSDPTKLMSDDTYLYYIDLYLTKETIYALNISLQQKDINTLSVKPCTIHLFDWDGNPKCEFHLDEFISRFVVDEANGKIYAISPLKSNQLICYKLPDVL